MLHLRFWLAPNQAGREREDPFHTLLYSVEATEVLVNARRRRTELYAFYNDSDFLREWI